MPARRVDLNADAGEGLEDEVLMPFLTSVSVACGGHTGDRESMARTLAAARRHGLRAGAHPGYPDPGSFGRAEMDISLVDLEESLRAQIQSLREVAREVGVDLTHVKAHGALYNRAWRDQAAADVIAGAVCALDPRAVVFCPGESAQADAARARGLAVVREVFLDRGYRPDGTLVPRGETNAVITETGSLAAQVSFLDGLDFETVCVHGDNPAALSLLSAVSGLVTQRGWQVAPYPVPG